MSHIGATNICTNQTISNVLFLPDFKVNLLSVSKLTKELNYMVGFFPNFCILQDLSTCQLKGIGKKDYGLYILQRESHQGPRQAPKKLVNTRSRRLASDESMSKSMSNSETIDVSHRRLGHAPIDVIKRHEFLSLLQNKDHTHCTMCLLAKHTKLPFSVSTTMSRSAFELLHCDIWGPYRVPTHNGKRFFVTIVDHYSRYTWVFLIASKVVTVVVFK